MVNKNKQWSILDGYQLILTSLLLWDYLRSPAEDFFLARVSKIGRGEEYNGESANGYEWKYHTIFYYGWITAMAIGHENV